MANAFPANALPFSEFGVTPRFAVEVDGTIQANFSECSGLGVTINVEKWEEGGANHMTHKFPGRADYEQLTLKHGVTDSVDLYNWFLEVLRGEYARKSITVKLLRPDLASEVRSWHFADAFPVKWTGPSLQATSNASAVETLAFAHGGLIGVR